MVRRERRSFGEDEIKDIMGKGFSRTFKSEIYIKGFEHRPLSAYPTKSAAFEIYDIIPETLGRVVLLPSKIVLKFYRDVERTSETTITSCNDEYRTEKNILGLGMAGRLDCEIDNRLVRVYPGCYSLGVREADEYMCILREFVNDLSLTELAKDKSWDAWSDFRNAYQTVALLHANSPWIIDEFRGELPEMTAKNIANGFSIYVSRIAEAAGNSLEEDKENKIKEVFEKIAEKYLCLPKFKSIVNGDLDIYSHHITKGPLLDAGSTRIGPLICDLVFSADPKFSRQGDLINRAQKSLEFYKEEKEKICEILQFDNHSLDGLSEDFLITSFLTASLRGGVRRAASIINYKFEYLPEFERRIPTWLSKPFRRAYLVRNGLPREQFENEVNAFLKNSFIILEELNSREEGFRKLEDILRQTLPQQLKVNTGNYGNPKLVARIKLGNKSDNSDIKIKAKEVAA